MHVIHRAEPQYYMILETSVRGMVFHTYIRGMVGPYISYLVMSNWFLKPVSGIWSSIPTYIRGVVNTPYLGLSSRLLKPVSGVWSAISILGVW